MRKRAEQRSTVLSQCRCTVNGHLPEKQSSSVFQRPYALTMNRLVGKGGNMGGRKDTRMVHEGMITPWRLFGEDVQRGSFQSSGVQGA